MWQVEERGRDGSRRGQRLAVRRRSEVGGLHRGERQGLGDVLDLESMKRTRSLLFDTEAEALTFADRHERTVADAGHFLGVAATEGGRWGVFLLRENVEGKLEAYMPDADVIRQDRDGSLSGSDGAPQDLPGIA